MGVPPTLLKRLRDVNAAYFLTNQVKIYRTEAWTDEYGGTRSEEILIGTFPARFVHQTYKEEGIGGGIQPRDTYMFVFSYTTGVEYQDKLIIVGDNHPNRYFLVTSVDDTTSEGMFDSAKCIESYN
jgi:hypothetical protein